MPLEILTVPCLRDNYAYLLFDPSAREKGACLVDACEYEPIQAALEAEGLSLAALVITHHHPDHINACESLRSRHGCAVMGPKAEAQKLPPLDRALLDNERFHAGPAEFRALLVPGHTLGHMAYYCQTEQALFSADSLMALGCGRLFEGTPPQMWESLSRLAGLPGATQVYSGHEYAEANARFALSLEPGNAALAARCTAITNARQSGHPTVPVTLEEELRTNPFLRPDSPEIRTTLGMSARETESEVFTEIRKRKDNF